jgi:hypothetical protein
MTQYFLQSLLLLVEAVVLNPIRHRSRMVKMVALVEAHLVALLQITRVELLVLATHHQHRQVREIMAVQTLVQTK